MRAAFLILLIAAGAMGIRLTSQVLSALTENRPASPGAVGPESHVPVQQSVAAPRVPWNVEIQQRVDEVLLEQQTLVGPADANTVQAADGSEFRPEHLPPRRHQAPLHGEMLTPGNFQYLGAFRPPHTDGQGKSFAYGGWGIAFRSDGDPEGAADGFSGSLFIVGHQNDQLVAEISIPRPLIPRLRRFDDLPAAGVLQDLGDITAGLRLRLTDNPSQPFLIGGLLVSGDRLIWTLYRYYNAEGYDFCSHGVSTLNTTGPIVSGPWHLGPSGTGASEWQAYKHAGYVFDVPGDYADQWLGGCRFVSGLQVATGLQTASHGPAMFAWRLPEKLPPDGASLEALPLVWNDQSTPAAGYHPADRFTGGCWLTLGQKHSVIIVGRKALGAFYYGEARPGDCTPDKGYHGPPYEAQVLFYSPASLVRSAHGAARPWEVVPWFRWDQNSPGGGIGQYLFPTCSQHLGGITWDQTHRRLYVSQAAAGATADQEYEVLPAIHVFELVDQVDDLPARAIPPTGTTDVSVP